MAFSRNAQRAAKASPHQPVKKQPKQPIPTYRNCPNPIISTIRQLPENEKDWSESMRHLLREMLQQQSKSMEAMLNSSINHFTQYISQHEDIQTQNHQLIRQNQRLAAAIEELRNILKQKLQAALRKQREDLNVMMQDYIKLIQKLLKDKQSFAARIQEEERRANMAQKLVNSIAEEQLKHQQILEAKLKVISELQNKINQHSRIIENKDAKISQLAKQNEQLKIKLHQITTKISSHTNNNIHNQTHQPKDDVNSSKCKFLLQLLQQSQDEIKKLIQRLRQQAENSPKDALIQQLRSKILQMQEEYEQQFKQYEQSMRQIMQRKDEHIQKLTRSIENIRKNKQQLLV